MNIEYFDNFIMYVTAWNLACFTRIYQADHTTRLVFFNILIYILTFKTKKYPPIKTRFMAFLKSGFHQFGALVNDINHI